MIKIRANNPQLLAEHIRQAIFEGRSAFWNVDKEGDYYIKLTEWKGLAWMRERFNEREPQSLYYGILEAKDVKMKKSTYAVYHCRLAEFLLSVFDNEIESLEISSMLDITYDIFSQT